MQVQTVRQRTTASVPPVAGGGTRSVSPPALGGGTSVMSPPPVQGDGGSPLERLDRRRIIAATIDVVATLGYGAVRTADIIAAAKVPRRTFWRSFEDKAAAVTGAYAEITRDVGEAVLQAREAQPDAVGRVVAVLQALAGFLAEDPVRAEVLLVQAPCAGRSVTEIRAEAMGSLTGLLADDLEAAAGRDVSVDRSLVVLESLVGGLYEVAYTRTFRGDAGKLPGLVFELARGLLTPYLGPGGARAAVAAAGA